MNKILKFGGTSLNTPERIKKVIKIIIKSQKDHSQIAVVFSALGEVTDQLIQIASLSAQRKNYKKLLKELEKRHLDTVESLITKQNQSQVLNIIRIKFRELQKELAAIFSKKELSLKDLDLVMSFGEWLSTYIISQALKNQGLKVEFLDARKFIRTDDSFGVAQVDYKITYRQIKNYFKTAKALSAITGFIASSQKGQTTTLGRGGSDFTAALFGAALSVDEVEIWTDVDGVMTTDPRKVVNAFPIKTMTYEEAMEMSHFGAKVIYPPTIRPVLDKKLPIRI
ncbi:aspartate kinase, partial [Patescibacteria group bacterium]|nr:aspartate kinase [Patescibacteria group bacterium]